MEANLVENLTIPSQNYAASFFHGYPTDTRFINNTYHKFMATTGLDATTQKFSLSRFEAPNVYMVRFLSNSQIEVIALR